jgi:hypothetical protein
MQLFSPQRAQGRHKAHKGTRVYLYLTRPSALSGAEATYTCCGEVVLREPLSP